VLHGEVEVQVGVHEVCIAADEAGCGAVESDMFYGNRAVSTGNWLDEVDVPEGCGEEVRREGLEEDLVVVPQEVEARVFCHHDRAA
jgi:hypothetical protein